MRFVALEAAASGITVNVIGPGFVDTGMVDAFRKGLALYVEGSDESLEERHPPLGRFLATDEGAAKALYIASVEAAGITGQAYAISCGTIQI